MYRIEVKNSVVKALKKLPRIEQIRISQVIQSLKNNPRPEGSIKLAGSPYYRVRLGAYRIIYEIQDAVLLIIILKVGHRKDVYR